MKKLITNKSHYEQVNLALAYVHNYFGSNITADDLANESGYSIFHFHRIFKEITGENVNDYIRNTRLEKASNLLLYNQHKTIEMIAQDSGFSTGTGFTAAFKKKFLMTPKDWRKGGYEVKFSKSAKTNISMIQVDNSIDIASPTIMNKENIHIIYMRANGYEDDMSSIWNNMHEWCEEMDVLNTPHKYIGLFHNHPSFEPYNRARYLACLETQEDVFRNGKVGRCKVSEGKFAKFEFSCTHKELYKMMHLAYMKWLPTSQYEVRNFPAYVEYRNPKELFCNGVLEVDFYMPIQLIM